MYYSYRNIPNTNNSYWFMTNTICNIVAQWLSTYSYYSVHYNNIIQLGYANLMVYRDYITWYGV